MKDTNKADRIRGWLQYYKDLSGACLVVTKYTATEFRKQGVYGNYIVARDLPSAGTASGRCICSS